MTRRSTRRLPLTGVEPEATICVTATLPNIDEVFELIVVENGLFELGGIGRWRQRRSGTGVQ